MTSTNTQGTNVPVENIDEATEAAQQADAQATSEPKTVEYSAGVVRLGNIVPVCVEPEATPDVVDTGDEDLEHKSFADFGVTDPIVDALEDK